jgi:hypothetical protein
MYFKMNITVRVDVLLTRWGYKAVDPSNYNISWSDTVIIENDEIKQLLKGMSQGDSESKERLREIAKGIEEEMTNFLLNGFVSPYFEASTHENVDSIIAETWKRLAKRTNDTVITLPTTRGFIIVPIPYVGIRSRSDDAGNMWYYMTTNDSYTISIITREDVHWLHDYLMKIEEKVQNLAELITISTSYTPEIECNCSCGY